MARSALRKGARRQAPKKSVPKKSVPKKAAQSRSARAKRTAKPAKAAARRAPLRAEIVKAAAPALGKVVGREHWTNKGDVRLFLFEKVAGDPARAKGTILFVHGSSMASQPTFDLQVPGRPDSSVMDWFARRGFDTWCVDMEGYGRSEKGRNNNADISQGADDCHAAAAYIRKVRGEKPLLVYGISSGALRAALFAERHPEMVARLALDAMAWTGRGSPTLEQRRQRLPEYLATNRRPIDRAFVRSIFTRDHPGTAEDRVIEAFADAILALDDSVPTGTYVDMCSKLPVVDPEKITVPTLIMRGQWDGIASFEDLMDFFDRLRNPDKQFAVMPGIAHASFQQKNYRLVYHILHSFFTQPAPVYTG
jgi:pimeloyl-ACP methyl ester carboxylesterase